MSDSQRRLLLDVIEGAYDPTEATVPTAEKLDLVDDALYASVLDEEVARDA